MIKRGAIAVVWQQAREFSREVNRRSAVLAMACMIAAVPATAAGPRADMTDAALERCLASPRQASTSGQTECEAAAARSYDQRMNVAYAALMRRLPTRVAQRLRRSQRAWLAFRDAEVQAQKAIYATRQGRMYVPMQSDDATTLIGDRARMLERYLRALEMG
jgi:uncharacterized protein YecT (DUF1311 family)